MFLVSKKGFTLTELAIATVLMGVIILAVTSVDITSRRFFGAASDESRIQDEAKIAMEHIVKNVQLGIGDVTNPGTSEGFTITGGTQIQVKRDGLNGDADGKFDLTDSADGFIEYNLQGNRIVYTIYDNNMAVVSTENLTDPIVTNAGFSVGGVANQVDAIIEVLRDPSKPESRENPKTTLTSSVVLRAMSTK